MTTMPQNYEMLVRLIASSWIAAAGVRVERTLTGPVALWQKGRYLGIWWYEDNEYRFAEVAFRHPQLTARTAEEALAKSIAMVVWRRGQAKQSRPRDPWLRMFH